VTLKFLGLTRRALRRIAREARIQKKRRAARRTSTRMVRPDSPGALMDNLEPRVLLSATPGVSDLPFEDQLALYASQTQQSTDAVDTLANANGVITTAVVDENVPTPQLQAVSIGFGKSTVTGASPDRPTSLQFGPDGRLYVSEQDGLIHAYTIVRNDANDYEVTAHETIDLVEKITNHDDDGSVNNGVNTRLVTGILVKGTADNPVLYVTSSDPRIGAGPSGEDLDLDTNSGMLSRLTWNGSSWDKVDLVRGLPRSEENHAPNGMVIDESTNMLYIAMGGNTNMGAPSNNFAKLPEYALSAAILSVDLDAIGDTTYDIPTLDDEDDPGADNNDPFGGNDGKNQAKIVPGGPVQVYAPGFRNPYDLVLTADGRMYTIDNGPNSGWGGIPDKDGGVATNDIVEGGSTKQDSLYLVTEGFYGGHPNPTRASTNNTFNDSNPQSPVTTGNPVESNYENPTVDPDVMALFPASTNGMVEYTASNFEGQMQGDLLAAGFDNKIYRIQLDAEGDDVTSKTSLFNSVGIVPLDVWAQGDDDIFPGTIWVVDIVSGDVIVFEPDDFDGSGDIINLDDPNFDSDGDGYLNGDEEANGTNPASAGDKPDDFDGDFTSDLLDDDDDNDGILDVDDAFAIDASNGMNNTIGVQFTWENDAPPAGGLLNLGFTGLMTNGTDNYKDLFDPAKMTAGGAAGVTTVDEISEGDAFTDDNDQEYAFQFGVNTASETDPFTATTRILAPFAATTPTDHQSMGLFIGNGDQDNYLKFVINANGGSGGMEVLSEVGGTVQTTIDADLSLPGPDFVDLFLTIDPVNLTAQASYSTTTDGVHTDRINIGGPVTIPSDWIKNTTRGLAVGIISTSTGPADPIPATWDHVKVLPEVATNANDDSYIVPKDSTTLLSVLDNDDIRPGDFVSISNVSVGSAGGTMTIIDGEKINYTPVNGFTGTETFTYTINPLFADSSVATVTVTVDEFGAPINFNDVDILSYDPTQDNTHGANVLDDGATINLQGNAWKRIEFPYEVTENTVIEFDFKSTNEGEVHGIGFDDDNAISSDKTFKVHGTQDWGIGDFDTYSGNGDYQHFVIPVGQFYTGSFTHLIFGNDHDAPPNDANGFFQNVKVYELVDNSIPSPPAGVTPLNLSGFTIDPFSEAQDIDGTATVGHGGLSLTLEGNAWKKINLPFDLKPDTILEFDFLSNSQGEIHGIGFDTDDSTSPDQFFQVYGTQPWATEQQFNDYDTPGQWKHYKIKVGDFFTGFVDKLVFALDHDVENPNGHAIFANVAVYDEGSVGANTAPVVTAIADQAMQAQQTLTVNISATDNQGDNITLTAQNVPTWANFTDNGDGTGSIEFNPTAGDIGTVSDITVIATDDADPALSSQVTFDLEVTAVPVPGDPVMIDFTNPPVMNFDADFQNVNGSHTVLDNGDSLEIQGNTWKKVALDYTVTENTIIEFDFSSTAEGEVQGIGFDNDDSISSNTMFRLFGTQDWGIADFDNYDGSGQVKHYVIPVGQFYTGEFNVLVFANDHDVDNPTAQSLFSNVKIYEQVDPGANVAPVLDVIDDLNVLADQVVTVNINATDANLGDDITLSVNGLPAFASFTDNGDGTGSIEFSPLAANIGLVSNITVVATDSGNPALSDTEQFSMTVTSPAPTEQNPLEILFNNFTVSPADPTQDLNGAFAFLDGFATLNLQGNTWKKIDLDYTVTENTVIEFDFKSTAEGEVHGIGFDDDNDVDSAKTFKLHGTQDWGIDNFDNYDGSGDYQHYKINVGQFYTGDFNALVFGNDHDVDNPTANSFFKNIKIYESDGGASNSAPTIDAIANQPLVANTPVTVNINANDGDNDNITLTAQNVPAWATFTDNGDGTGTIEFNPTDAQIGEDLNVTVIATDDGTPNLNSQAVFNVTVSAEAPGVVLNPINFQTTPVSPFDAAAQNLAGGAGTEDAGATLHLNGNNWQKLDAPITITADTVLEFDFKSTSEGEVHAIGFDVDDSISSTFMFRLFGTQDWGIDDFNNYNGSGDYQHYVIPVGQFFTGEFNQIVFANDHDVPNPTANGYFKNVKIYENGQANNTAPVITPILNQSVDPDGTLTVNITAVDGENDDITLEVANLPAYASFTDNGDGTGSIEFNPTDTDKGTSVLLTITATDDGTPVQSSQSSFTLTVNDPDGGGTGDFVNFNDDTPAPFDAEFQNVAGGATVEDGGLTLNINGNNWQKIDLDYSVTLQTVIEFDFKSSAEGEIQGIGFDNDDSISSDRIFKLFGTQSWGIGTFDNYDGSGNTKHYKINVGQFYTGDFNVLVFANDHDVASPNAESIFSNVKIYEDESLPTNTGTWTQLASSTLERHEIQYVELDGKLYLTGGRGDLLHEVYDPTTNTWSTAAPLPFEVTHTQAVVHDGEYWLMGGLEGPWTDFHIDTVVSYNPTTNAWTTHQTMAADRARGGGGAVVHDGKIYVAGGLRDDNTGTGHFGTSTKMFDVYDPATDTWTQMPDMPRERDHFQAVIHNGKLYAVGGREGGDAGFFNQTIAEVDVFDFATNTWSTLPTTLPTPRAAAGTVLIGDEIIVIGGEGNGQAYDTVEAYNIVTGTWRTLTPAPIARHGAQAAVFNNEIYIVAGSTVQGANATSETVKQYKFSLS